MSTVHTESLSALGCLSGEDLADDDLPSGGAPVTETCSTSKPRKVIARVISSTGASSAT